MSNDTIVCNCMQITRGEIVKAILENNIKTIEELQEATEAGTVCGNCIDDLEAILEETLAKP